MPSRRLPRAKLAIERFTLDNGLRVVLSPDRSAPVVGISLYVDVGFRSEPKGRTGFAHLFEHLMFQETPNLDKGVSAALVEGNGGNLNGSTHPDFTVYVLELPSNALELGLYLQADRMRGSRITPESLQNQIDVVKEEINVNVNNRPYGGFLLIDMPALMFDTFNNSHNGYGSFVDLESATVADAEDFFDGYYSPGNAVLSIAGDLDPREVRALVERHFGPIAPRLVPPLPDCSEPLLTSERRLQKPDPLAPIPAMAIGYRMPDPINAFDEFLALVVLADVLAGGDASRLHQRLVKKDRTAVDVATIIGPFGEVFETRDPAVLQFLAFYPGVPTDTVLAAIDDEIAQVAAGVSEKEVDRVVTSLVSGHLHQLDNVLQRGMAIGLLEQQRNAGELVNDLPSLLGSVTAAGVAEAASRWLAQPGRAVLEVVPSS